MTFRPETTEFSVESSTNGGFARLLESKQAEFVIYRIILAD